MVIVFSGGGTAGHFHPACNVADALMQLLPGARPYFVGTEGRIEARELPRMGRPYTLLRTVGLRHPLRSGNPLAALAANLRALWMLVAAVARLVPDFRRREARAVVLTGGYVCAPAGIAARLLGLPVVLQEQNTHAGKVTRLVARWARQIHTAHPETAATLPPAARARVRESGNPIRPLPARDADARASARPALGLPPGEKVVLVVGGSQGAGAINDAALEIVREGLNTAFVFWVTGPANFGEMERRLAAGAPSRSSHRIVPYLEPASMYQALAAADLAVSRAGAMATSEFLAWGLPAILIPLPTAAADHQTANARSLARCGAAVLLPETGDDGQRVSGEQLWKQAAELLASPDRLAAMSSAASARARPDAARDIAAAVAEVLA